MVAVLVAIRKNPSIGVCFNSNMQSPFFRTNFREIGLVDARRGLPYTEISLAVNASRTSLLCSWNLERVKGNLARVCFKFFPEKF